MATAYVAVGYLVDDDGVRHEFADEVEFPTTTEQEQASFNRLLDYGIISVDKPKTAQ